MIPVRIHLPGNLTCPDCASHRQPASTAQLATSQIGNRSHWGISNNPKPAISHINARPDTNSAACKERELG
jgi:hypothetical protein